jgi:hypothetical protein
MENEEVPNGVCIDGRYRGGAGLAVFEWLHVPGFLEVASRDPQRGDPDPHQAGAGGLALGEQLHTNPLGGAPMSLHCVQDGVLVLCDRKFGVMNRRSPRAKSRRHSIAARSV